MKKKFYFAVALFLVLVMTVSAFSATTRGDLSGDGTVSLEDVIISIRMLLEGEESYEADVNRDGSFNLRDVLRLLKICVGGEEMPEFSPINIEGLVARFDASELSLNDGDKVTKWENTAVGDKFDAIATSEDRAPTFVKESLIGGKCGVALDKTSSMYLVGSDALHYDDFSIFAVVRPDSIAASSIGNDIFSKLENVSPYQNHNWYFNINHLNNFNFGWRDTNYAFHDCNAAGCAMKVDTDYILGGVKGGTNASLYLNGNLAGKLFAATSATMQNTGFVYIGASESFSRSMDGTICEILLYDRALTVDETKEIYTYLSEKWDIDITMEAFNLEKADISISVGGEEIREFNKTQYQYKRALAYGTAAAPAVTATCYVDGKAVDVTVTQASSVNGKATVQIPDCDVTYTVEFSVMEEALNLLDAPTVTEVAITDGFIKEKIDLYEDVTLDYVLDSFQPQGAISNYQAVIDGTSDITSNTFTEGIFLGAVTAAADLLAKTPNDALKAKIDGYADVIYKASLVSENGYLSTHAMVEKPGLYFDETGNAVKYHDAYNFGCLIEAGVHYYRATGEMKLLYAGVRFAEFIADNYGYGLKADGTPKINMVPSHSMPEETLMELYNLLKEEPELVQRLETFNEKYPLSIDAEEYADLVRFWIENKANTNNRLATYGTYAQDHEYYFNQKVAVGHAVRANLYYAGMARAGASFKNHTYIKTAKELYENIRLKQMYVTGSTGVTKAQEAYSVDYDLPNDGYCETCASVALALYSDYMARTLEDANYAETLETLLYNSILGCIGEDGKSFYYIQPLNSTSNARWSWHGCPCCPPMFLKFFSRLETYIYAYDADSVYVNQFIPSEAVLANGVTVSQTTDMPYAGNCTITVSGKDTELCIRIPTWADSASLKINGANAEYAERNGYAVISVNDGDIITYTIAISPRRIYANENVRANVGRVALGYGPFVYCVEGVDNAEFADINASENSVVVPSTGEIVSEYCADLLGGVTRLSFTAKDTSGNKKTAYAIPFYARNNRGTYGTYVWLREDKDYTPEDFDGLVARFDALTLTLNDGAEVTEWKNLAGDSLNAVSTGSTKNPVFVKSSALNGKNGVSFERTDGLKLSGSENLHYDDFSIFMVMRADTIYSGDNGVFSKLGCVSPHNHNWYFTINGASKFNFGWKGTNNAFHDCGAAECKVSAGTNYILAGTKDGKAGTLYINSTKVGTLASAVTTAVSNTYPICIGANPSYGTGTAMTICEILLYNRGLSAEEASHVNEYLSEKWLK